MVLSLLRSRGSAGPALLLCLLTLALAVPPTTAQDTDGPTLSSVVLAPAVLPQGEGPLVVEATATDVGSGGSTIAAALVALPALGIAADLQATDGAFDEVTETLRASLDSALWPQTVGAPLEVQLRAMDSLGNTGPTTLLTLAVVSADGQGPPIVVLQPAQQPLPQGTLTLTLAIEIGEDPEATGAQEGAAGAVTWSLGPLPTWDQGNIATTDLDLDGHPREATLILPTADWTQAGAPYRLWVRAEDAQGNWGPPSWVDLTVGPPLGLRGPKVVSVELSSAAVTEAIGATFLRAVVDGSEAGSSLVVAAEASIAATPSWPGQALQPLDGAFDQTIEVVGMTLNLSGLSPGPQPQEVWVRGQDDGGRWGPPRSTRLWLLPLPQWHAPDRDGDGTVDDADRFPSDPLQWSDSDGDGVGDDTDLFPADPGEQADTDGDGVGDHGDAFPLDPFYTTDSDGDLTPDHYEVWTGRDPADPADRWPSGEGRSGVEGAITQLELGVLWGGAVALAVVAAAIAAFVRQPPRRGRSHRPGVVVAVLLTAILAAAAPPVPGFPSDGAGDSNFGLQSCTINTGCHALDHGPGGAVWSVQGLPTEVKAGQPGIGLSVRVDLSGTGGEQRKVGVFLLDGATDLSILSVEPHFRLSADANGNDPPRSYNQRPQIGAEDGVQDVEVLDFELTAPPVAGTYQLRVAVVYDDKPGSTDPPVLEHTTAVVVVHPPDDIWGPTVAVDELRPATVVEGLTARLTVDGTADDTTTGGGTIFSVEYGVGPVPSWPGSVAAPDDGAFDGATEAFSVVLDTSSWNVASSPYRLWLRSRDGVGNVGPEVFADIAVVGDSSDTLGPLVRFGSAPPPLAPGQGQLSLQAVADETLRGLSGVSAAQWVVGPAPLWPGTPLQASDGGYGDVVEEVRAVVDLVALPLSGPSLLWVRARDGRGNWGPDAALPLLREAGSDGAGPEVMSLSVDPPRPREGQVCVVTVTLQERPAGVGTVATGRWSLQPLEVGPIPRWEARPLAPLDGWANGSTERFGVAVGGGLSPLRAGLNLLQVHGTDRGGTFGSSVALEVEVLPALPGTPQVTFAATLDPEPVAGGTEAAIELTAAVADPNLAIVALEARPGAGFPWLPLDPVDGAYDGPSEGGRRYLDTRSWLSSEVVVVGLRAQLPDGTVVEGSPLLIQPRPAAPDGDHDGIPDESDGFPTDPYRTVDSDHDGRDDHEELALGMDPATPTDGQQPTPLQQQQQERAAALQTRSRYLVLLQVVAATTFALGAVLVVGLSLHVAALRRPLQDPGTPAAAPLPEVGPGRDEAAARPAEEDQ